MSEDSYQQKVMKYLAEMPWKSQKKAERVFKIIIIAVAIISYLIGYIYQHFSICIYSTLIAMVIAMIVSIQFKKGCCSRSSTMVETAIPQFSAQSQNQKRKNRMILNNIHNLKQANQSNGNVRSSWCGAISGGSCLSPNPSFASVVVVEVSPKVELSGSCLSPIPGLLDEQVDSIHSWHVPSAFEGCKGCFGSVGSLAEVVSNDEAIDLQSHYWISDCEDSSSPALVEGLIGVGVGGEVGIVVIVRSVESLRMDNAEHRQSFGARCVSLLWVASIAAHSSHKTIAFFGQYSRAESESSLDCNSLSIV